MGEARRRKLLDPNYGKVSQKPYSGKNQELDELFAKYKIIASISEAKSKEEDSKYVSLCKAILLGEEKVILRSKDYKQNELFKSACLNLAELVVKNFDSSSILQTLLKTDEEIQIAREAGRILASIGGTGLMIEVCETLVPKSCHREIDITWDGIGGWMG